MSSMHTTAGAGAPADPLRVELDIRRFSNISKALGAHLREHHQVQLTHTQVRTAVACALGFDSPNALDALLKERVASTSPSAPATTAREPLSSEQLTSLTNGGDHAHQEERMRRMGALTERLSDLLDMGKQETLVDLVNLQVVLLAKQYPPALSAEDRKRIQANYPKATDSLIAERACGSYGLEMALGMAHQLATIAVDYSPGSMVADVVQKDQAPELDSVGPAVAEAGRKLFAKALGLGLSPFGTATLLCLVAMGEALRSGAAWPALARIPLAGLQHIVLTAAAAQRKPSEPPSIDDLPKEKLDDIAGALARQMGVSKATARKYVREFSKRKLK